MTIFENAMSYMDGSILEEKSLSRKDWKAVGKEYKYSDRYKFGFYFRNFGSIFKNMMTDKSETYEKIRPNLLKMVDSCKTMNDINYLRRDVNAAITQLTALKTNKPERAKACNDQIKWLKTDCKDAINKKAKEIRKLRDYEEKIG